MSKQWLKILTLGFALTLYGCSSSETHEGDMPGGDEAIPELDAGTDAVPLESAEQPQLDESAGAPAPTPSVDPLSLNTDTPTPVAEAPAPAPEVAPEALAPAPAAEPVAHNDAPLGGEDYTVKTGDTLMKIAFESYGDLYKWKEIYERNRDKISNPSHLDRGTVLKLDPTGLGATIERNGEKYMIKPGDTLGRISDDVYGTPSKWKKIYENNRQLIKDPNKIFAGFYLYYVPEADHPVIKHHPLAKKQNEDPALPAETTPAVEMPREPASVAPPKMPSGVSRMEGTPVAPLAPATSVGSGNPVAPNAPALHDTAAAVPPPPTLTVPPAVEDPTQTLPVSRVPAAGAPATK